MESSLLIDCNYMAVSVIGWKKAFKLLVKNKVEPMSDNVIKVIKSHNASFKIPSIIRLKDRIGFSCFFGKIRFSKRNVMVRDDYCCQYCGVFTGRTKGTLDHIIPKSRGGPTDYVNCVVCCQACNIKKGARTPAEAKMQLLKQPKRPNFFISKEPIESVPSEWKTYLVGVK